MPYLMPNGKWRAKRMIHGQVKTKVFQTKQEAKKWEAVQEAQAWEAESSTTPMVCLLDFSNAYLDMATERFVRKTVSEKKLAFRYLFKTIPQITSIETLTPSMALEALRMIARKVTGNAANVARKNLLAAWEWGKKYYGLPIANPFRDVEKFPADQSPRYVPREEDFWKVYERASQDDKTMLLLMLHTGARRTEVFRLQWSDVDMPGRKIRFGTRKIWHGGMEYEWVSMTTELHSILSGHKMKRDSVFVLTDSKTGEPYKTRKRFMEKLCKRTGVKPFGFHAINSGIYQQPS